MEIEIVRNEQVGTLTASIPHEAVANLPNSQVNILAAKLLVRLATEIAKEEEYEFDGINTPDFSDGKISLVANLFIP